MTEPPGRETFPFGPTHRPGRLLSAVVVPVLSVAVAAGVAWVLPHGRLGAPAAVFLLAVFASSFTSGFWSGIGASVLAVLALDLFFIAPTGSLHPITADEWALLAVFFVVAAVAAWTLQRQQHAREVAESERNKASALASVISDLAQATGLDHVGRVLVGHMTTVLGAKGAGVFLLDPSGERVTTLSAQGYPDDLMSRWASFPLSAGVPAAEAIRERRTILLGSLAERLDRYELMPRDRPTMGPGALAALPLMSGGQPIGAVTISFAEDHRFTAADERFLRVLALEGANAIERARLREQEQRLGQRSEFLAEASRILAGSLDYQRTLEDVAQLAIPRFADWAAVDLLTQDGRIELVAVAHRDPEMVRLAREFRERRPPSMEDPAGLAAVLRSGRSELHPALEQAELEAQAEDEEVRELLRRLQLRSLILAPLIARERVLGVMTLITSESGRHYGQEDLEVAENLAGRAALAIDNARLYRAEGEARSAVEGAESRLRVLSAASRALASSLDLSATLQEVTRLAVQHLADSAVVYLADEGGNLRTVALAHADPDRRSILERMMESYDPARNAASHVVRAFQTGEPEVIDDIVGALRGADMEPGFMESLSRLGVVSAVAMPLVIGPRAVGVLALASSRARSMAGADLALAEELARRMARAIENARLYEERDRTARALQQNLLPRSFPEVPGVQVEARYRPAGEAGQVGGDFYDLFEAGPNRWIAAIGDVCGKGPEAAAAMGVARFTLRALSLHESRPNALLSLLSESMLAHGLADQFVTIGCCLVEPAPDGPALRVRLSLAGHPRPVVLRGTGEAELIGEHGVPVGLIPSPALAQTEHRIDPGDTLVLYTDGLDVPGMSAEDRVVDLLSDRGVVELKDVVDTLILAAAERVRRIQDDVAVLALRLTR